MGRTKDSSWRSLQLDDEVTPFGVFWRRDIEPRREVKRDSEKVRRNHQMMIDRDLGMSLNDLSAKYKLSRGRVSDIVARERPGSRK